MEIPRKKGLLRKPINMIKRVRSVPSSLINSPSETEPETLLHSPRAAAGASSINYCTAYTTRCTRINITLTPERGCVYFRQVQPSVGERYDRGEYIIYKRLVLLYRMPATATSCTRTREL